MRLSMPHPADELVVEADGAATQIASHTTGTAEPRINMRGVAIEDVPAAVGMWIVRQ